MNKARAKAARERRNSRKGTLMKQPTISHHVASTYEGPLSDSDQDEYHITKPFVADEGDLHPDDVSFSSDEGYEPEQEEQNEHVNLAVENAYDLIRSLQNTIAKMGMAMRGENQPNFKLADTLRRGILNNHPEFKAFDEDWKPLESDITRRQPKLSARQFNETLSKLSRRPSVVSAAQE